MPTETVRHTTKLDRQQSIAAGYQCAAAITRLRTSSPQAGMRPYDCAMDSDTEDKARREERNRCTPSHKREGQGRSVPSHCHSNRNIPLRNGHNARHVGSATEMRLRLCASLVPHGSVVGVRYSRT